MGNCSNACKDCGAETQGSAEPGSSNTDQPHKKRRKSPKTNLKNTSVQVAEDELSVSENYNGEDESVQSADDNINGAQTNPILPPTPGIDAANSLSVPTAEPVDSTLGGVIHWRKVAELSALMSRDIKLKVWNGVFKTEKDHHQPEYKRMGKVLQTFVMLSLTKVECI